MQSTFEDDNVCTLDLVSAMLPSRDALAIVVYTVVSRDCLHDAWTSSNCGGLGH